MKRTLDLVFAMGGLIICLPFFAGIALAIKFGSAGPVLYKAERVGQFGRTFQMLKFRTMVRNADQIGAASTPEDDPRVTRIGGFLRKFKLDELPQLLNVLSGDMSLIGPRPQIPWAVARYTEEEKKVLSVRPGMSDYASLHFSNEGEILRGSLDPDKDYFEKIHPEKMRLSLEYVRDHSLAVDCKIMAYTMLRVFLRSGPQNLA